MHGVFDTLTLGDLIDALEAVPLLLPVEFGFCGAHPTKLNSYRGYYDHLAIGWSCDGDAPTADVLLTKLKAAVGTTFEGYKGGSYRMDRSTPVWVDNTGTATSTRIVEVEEDADHGVVFLRTKYDPPW